MGKHLAINHFQQRPKRYWPKRGLAGIGKYLPEGREAAD